MEKQGIDVSYYQGDIDWEKVKDQVDFAILRCGYGVDRTSQDDTKFHRNASECTRLGIPFGIYLFSYARGTAEASSEADHALRLAKNYRLEYPIYYDIEANSYTDQNSNEMLVKMCQTFCDKIEQAGYYVGIYSSKAFFQSKLNSPKLDRYDKWLAQWSNLPTYDKPFGMWQYTSDGSISGINGRVDRDIAYLDYPMIIKERGLNHLDESTEPTDPDEPPTNQKTYVVKAGDNLSTIASRYQTTVATLVALNHIKNPNLIYPGQVLILPSTAVEPTVYIVKKGDNLSKIVKQFGTTWQTIYNKNKATIGDNPNRIYPGQRLII